MASIDFPDTLSAAWQDIQAGRLAVDTAHAVQAGVTAFAAEAGLDRYEVEMALKRAVQHPEG